MKQLFFSVLTSKKIKKIPKKLVTNAPVPMSTHIHNSLKELLTYYAFHDRVSIKGNETYYGKIDRTQESLQFCRFEKEEGNYTYVQLFFPNDAPKELIDELWLLYDHLGYTLEKETILKKFV